MRGQASVLAQVRQLLPNSNESRQPTFSDTSIFNSGTLPFLRFIHLVTIRDFSIYIAAMFLLTKKSFLYTSKTFKLHAFADTTYPLGWGVLNKTPSLMLFRSKQSNNGQYSWISNLKIFTTTKSCSLKNNKIILNIEYLI